MEKRTPGFPILNMDEQNKQDKKRGLKDNRTHPWLELQSSFSKVV